MIDLTCETCDCWVREGNSDNGACHRYPPIPYPMPVKQSNIVGLDRPVMGQICIFPLVGKNNWCAEWSDSTEKTY